MPINSRSKGARGEREWRDELRAQGYLKARRGQQFSGSPDSPDVVCEELSHIHFEVKRTERLNIYDAYGQAKRDAGRDDGNRKTPVVAHKRNHGEWLVIMSAEDWFKMVRELEANKFNDYWLCYWCSKHMPSGSEGYAGADGNMYCSKDCFTERDAYR